ncbi:hypothetical protein TYRP_022884 [Tyrophagus putrescentiae]|nr:hypothetical protein TYRP_022884 [Tyrophagus putrescentiae]
MARGLAPLVHFKLPLPRVPRAKRAGPEETEVDSGQDTSEIREKPGKNNRKIGGLHWCPISCHHHHIKQSTQPRLPEQHLEHGG